MTTIKLKNGSGAPTAGDLAQGEPALDLTNKRLYTEDSGGTVIEVGTNPGTDVTFADNRKAIFGAGSDLQIYHDGSTSRIVDSGTGNLIIAGTELGLMNAAQTTYHLFAQDGGDVRLGYNGSYKLATTSTGIDVTGTVVADGLESSGGLTFTAADGIDISGKESVVVRIDSDDNDAGRVFQVLSGPSASQEILIQASEDAGVSLYYDNAAKLATTSTGIDVTGTVTADDAVYIEGSSPRVQLQDTDGTTQLSFFQQTGEDLVLRLRNNTADGGFTVAGYGGASTTNRFYVQPNGDISFYEDTGTTAKLFWDASAESLGIGTSSPASLLQILGSPVATSGALATFRNSDATSSNTSFGGILFNSSPGTDYSIGKSNVNATTTLSFRNGNTGVSYMDIDSSGQVGIGTSSPSSKVDIVGGDITGGLKISADKTTSAFFAFGADANETRITSTSYGGYKPLTIYTGGSERMRITSTGNVGIGTSNPDTSLHVTTPSGTKTELNLAQTAVTNYRLSIPASTDALTFVYGASTERMRIDASGNVTIGSSTLSADAALKFQADTGTFTLNHDRGTHALVLSDSDGTGEILRVDTSGNLLVGTTDNTLYNNTTGDGIRLSNGGEIQIANTNDIPLWLNRMGTDGVIVTISKSGTAVGSISVTSSATTYNTSSDQRLKDNIVDAPSASDDIDAIQVRSFDWKANGSHQKYGMVAQELESVAPEAVTGDADSDDMMGVDYSKLVPMMLKEIQSLRARVAQLEGEN